MTMLDWRTTSWSLGLFCAVMFVTCVAWGLVTPAPLHMHELLEMLLPAFVWLTPTGFVLGFIESFLYGFFAGIVFAPIHNRVARFWVRRDALVGGDDDIAATTQRNRADPNRSRP